MSIGISVNGRFELLPQVIPILDASELISAEQGSQNILAIVGKGTGMIRPKTIQAVDVTTGVLDRQIVANSEILRAAKMAINPSRETPGVSQLRLICVNPAVQSSKILVDTTGAPVNVITLTSRGWGAKFNDITVQVDNTEKEVTLKLDFATEIFTYGTGVGALAALVAKINDQSGIASAVLMAAGNDTLATIAATPFTAGSDGSVTNQDWTDVFEVLKQNNVNLIHVVDDTVGVAQMLADHCENERRIGFCGYTLQTGWGVANTRLTNIGNLKTRAAAIGSPNVLFAGIGSDNEPSYISVAKYAGIAAGIDPTVPLNNKDLATITVETELSIEEATELLGAGVSPPFRRLNPSRPGFVIADGLGTYTGNDNLFDRIISIRRGAYAMERDISNEVEQFLGQEATEVTIGRVVTTVNRRLTRALRRDVSTRIAAFNANYTRAVFESTVLRIFYAFEPIQPIRFIVPIGSLKPTIIERTIELPIGQ